ncbi:MAG TPA: hypothetical protein VF828_00965 [Patescibacteria group bacterium]
MDLTQIVVIISLLAITSVIVFSGVWLVNVLKEFRVTVSKVNSILDDTKMITSSVAQPVSTFSEFLMGFRSGVSLFNKLFGNKKSADV